MSRAAPSRALAALLAAWVHAAAAAPADDAAGRVVRDRGVRLAQEGRCESALPELDAARATAPDDVEVALLAGQCRIRLRRYANAARDLEVAAERAPGRADVWLALAKARYHARDLDGASAALDRASAALPDDAEVLLYTGMLQLERGEHAAAVRSLERARAQDADRVEPVASYYLGLAHGARDPAAAGAALERVTDAWRGTDWAQRAGQSFARLQRRGDPAARHAWIAVGAGFEQDSNVVLRGRGVALPDDISGDDDQRGVWTANGGLEVWKNESLTLGAMASYRGTTHDELHDYDSHFPNVTAWADLALDEATSAGARYDFGYAWLDGDPFVATNSWQLSLRRALGSWGESEGFGRAYHDDYFVESDDVPEACAVGVVCGPPGVDESRERDRSGWGLAAGLVHTLPIPADLAPLDGLEVSGGYQFDYFDAHGTEYSYRAHEVLLGLAVGLPYAIGLETGASFTYRPYLHPTTYPDPPLPTDGAPYPLSGTRRREKTWRVEAELSRPITDQLVISGRWRYIDNDSTAKVFDYDQHVLGVYLTLLFGREL